MYILYILLYCTWFIYIHYHSFSFLGALDGYPDALNDGDCKIHLGLACNPMAPDTPRLFSWILCCYSVQARKLWLPRWQQQFVGRQQKTVPRLSWSQLHCILNILEYSCMDVYRRKFRSQTSDNMDKWKAEMGRVKEEKRRRKKIKKRKCQKKEDSGARKGRKVAKHSVFPMICGSGGSKSRLAKAAGAEPAGQMRDETLHAVAARSTFRSQNVQNTPGSDHSLEVEMLKKCMPLWREVLSEVKMYKTHHARTTFGSWDVEKLHAIVARSTFRSKNAQSTPGFGPPLEVEMSKKCTPLWREAHFEVNMYKTHHARTTFGSGDVEQVDAVVVRSTFRSQNVQNTPGSDHSLEVEMLKKCMPLWREVLFEVKMYKTHHARTTFGSWDVEKLHAIVARSTFRSKNAQSTPGFGPPLEVEMSKKCTPLWREAHFEVNMYKTHHARTTFGSGDVEQVDAVVARSTFRSQSVQSTPGPDHFWKLRCQKKCTPLWREAHCQVKMYKTPQLRSTFRSWDVEKVHAVVARSTCRSQNVKSTRG